MYYLLCLLGILSESLFYVCNVYLADLCFFEFIILSNSMYGNQAIYGQPDPNQLNAIYGQQVLYGQQ